MGGVHRLHVDALRRAVDVGIGHELAQSLHNFFEQRPLLNLGLEHGGMRRG